MSGGVKTVQGIVTEEQWLEYLEGEPKFSKYVTFENCVFQTASLFAASGRKSSGHHLCGKPRIFRRRAYELNWQIRS